MICRQRGEGVQMTVAAAAEQFEELMHNCQNFSKHIAKIVKAAKTQLAEAKKSAIRWCKESMVCERTTLRWFQKSWNRMRTK